MKPKLYTDREFYKQMIESEEENKQTGWTERVKHIKAVMAQQEALEKMSKTVNFEDLVPGYNDLLEQKKLVEQGKQQKVAKDGKC